MSEEHKENSPDYNDDLIYEELLNELRENRGELSNMLESAVEFRKQINDIMPASTDFKKRWVMDEKLKLIVSIFGVELDIRKQKESSLKSEIEIRRRLTKVDEDDGAFSFENIAAIAKQIELIEGKRIPKYKKKIVDETNETSGKDSVNDRRKKEKSDTKTESEEG
jgi:hypothetical protein